MYRSIQLSRYLAPFIPALTEPNTPTMREIAMVFLKVKRRKPHLRNWYVTVVSHWLWSNCLTSLMMVTTECYYRRYSATLHTAELKYSEAGLLKNCQQCRIKKLWGDDTLFTAWRFHSASQIICYPEITTKKLQYSAVLAQKHLKRTTCLNVQEQLNLSW